MRKILSALLIALLPVVALAGGNYPSALPDATHVSQSLSQTRTNTIIDEVWNLANELGLNFAAHGKANLVTNGSVEVWSAGASAAPDGWTLSGTGAAVARQADGQDDTYSAQITAGTSASKLEQTVAATISAAVNARLRGSVSMLLAARVKTSTASACRLQITDGVGSSQSSYHTGGGAWEYLSVTRTLDTSATTLLADLLNDKTDGTSTCRFDSIMLVEGKFAQKAFVPRAGDINAMTATTAAALASNPTDCGAGTKATAIAANGDLTCSAVSLQSDVTGAIAEAQTIDLGGSASTERMVAVLCVNSTSTCTGANTTETDLFTCTVPASALGNGTTAARLIYATTWGHFGANGNTKTVRIYWNGSLLDTLSGASNNIAWGNEARIIESGANAQVWFSRFGSATAADGTGSATTSGGIVLKWTGQNGTASANDVCFKGGVVLLGN